jgi:hypothetical protein
MWAKRMVTIVNRGGRLFKGILVVLLLIQCSALMGQKVLKLPNEYYRPIDYLNAADADRYQTNEWPSNKSKDYWLVVSDRPEVYLLDKPDQSGIKIAEFPFKTYAWVVEQKGSWLKVALGRNENGKVNNPVASGWVNKRNLLLWPNSLMDDSTKISRKAFLLNKVGEIDLLLKSQNLRLVNIYDGPESNKVVDVKNIYEVYFIYKRVGNRILIGGNNRFNHVTAKDNIIGWVDEYRVQRWDQRLALECSFVPEIFDFRKKYPNSRVIGFKTQTSADIYAKSGKINESEVLWDNDPIKSSQVLLAPTNPRRVKGEVFRFPVFSMTSGYIQSGALAKIPTKKADGSISGEIKTEDLLGLQDLLKQFHKKRDKINIYFLVEATREMQSYKSSILEAIQNIENELPGEVSIHYGAAVYRDAELRTTGEHFKLQKLSPNKRNVLDFIGGQVFDQGTNLDAWTNFRWALSEVLIRGEIPSDEQNIIITLGINADFSFSRIRSKLADSKDLIVEDKYYQLERRLKDLQINLAFIQLKNDSGNNYSKFAEDGRALIVNNGLRQYASYSQLLSAQYSISDLQVPDLEDRTELEVFSVALGYIRRPARGKSLSREDVSISVASSVVKVYGRQAKAYNYLLAKVEGGKAGAEMEEEFAPIIWAGIEKQIASQKISMGAMGKLLDEKIKFYNQIYLPRRSSGVTQLYSTVVFMPDVELDEYISTLEMINRSMLGPSDEKREKLYEVLVELMRQLTGDKKGSIDKTSIDDLRARLNGLAISGFDMDDKLGFRIQDVKNKKILSDAQLEVIAERVVTKLAKLKEIRNLREKYDFSYTVVDGQSVYYWIETNLLF